MQWLILTESFTSFIVLGSFYHQDQINTPTRLNKNLFSVYSLSPRFPFFTLGESWILSLHESQLLPHTRSYAVWNENIAHIGFYLMLVIDCEKLISKDGCSDIAPHNDFTKNPNKNRTNSIIVNKKVFFASVFNMRENDDLRNTINYVSTFSTLNRRSEEKSVTSQ